MARDIYSIALPSLLPDSLRADQRVIAAAQAVEAEFQSIAADAEKCLLLPRLDALPEPVLDLLAWQWHVDYYELLGLSIETKRDLIRRSIAWHRHKGTPAAVEEIVEILTGCPAQVREWFEYYGQPGCFKVQIMTPTGPTTELKAELIAAIYTAKNTRSHLDGLIFVKKPIVQNPLFLNYGGPPIIQTTDLSYDETRRYVVFATGVNATGRAEDRAETTTSVTTTGYKVFTGPRLGQTRLNRVGRRVESVTKTPVYRGEIVQSIYIGARLGGMALNRRGAVKKILRDVGTDQIVAETIFDGSALNRAALRVETEVVRTTTYQTERLFTSARINGRSPLTLNAACRKTCVIEVVAETIQRCKRVGPSAQVLGGRLRLNSSAAHVESRTEHFTDWREVVQAKGGANLNDAPKMTRREAIYETVVTRRQLAGGHTLNAMPTEIRTKVEQQAVTQAYKVLRSFYALNRSGVAERTLQDIGADQTVAETIFDGAALNRADLRVETDVVRTTTYQTERLFTSARINGRSPLTLNAARRKTRVIEVVAETIQRRKRAGPGAQVLGGRLRLNSSAAHVESRTEHFTDWREIVKYRRADRLNALRHEERADIVRHEQYETVKKYNAKLAHLLNGKKALGYITI